MPVNDMLIALSQIWRDCVINYPEADHGEILKLIEQLQSIIFCLEE
jgi:hypothetical protein